MAVFALVNEFVTVNAVDLSNRVKSAVLTLDVDALDVTAMSNNWKTMIGGLKSGQLAITFNDDFALSNVDATLFPLLGTVVAFEVRPDAGARSTTNPGYTGSVLITGHTVGGGVGEAASKQLTFPTSGTVQRQTA